MLAEQVVAPEPRELRVLTAMEYYFVVVVAVEVVCILPQEARVVLGAVGEVEVVQVTAFLMVVLPAQAEQAVRVVA